MIEWNERYRSGDLPWETGRVDAQLVNVINRFDIRPCRVLDFGCGTGNNAIWLAEQGFDVTAIDISTLAVAKALGKTDEALGIEYITGNILEDTLCKHLFRLIFDRGCFHSMPTSEDRTRCAQRMHEMLERDGLWLSLIGNADQDEREAGPPRMTAAEISTVLEPYFEILLLEAGFFDSDQADPPRCWACLLRRRHSVR